MTVRVGVIGLGVIGQAHINVLRQLNTVEITCVCDNVPERAHSMAVATGAKAFTQPHEFINQEHIDALFVCSPPFARDNIEETAAAQGVHLLVEKPLGLDLSVVKRKEQAILRSDILHSSGYCLRYLDIVQIAKEYLADKQVDLILSRCFAGVHTPTWWSQLELSGGQFVDQTTHQVDLIRYPNPFLQKKVFFIFTI